MKQVVRRVIDRGGGISIEEIPTPHVGDNQVLISTHYTLISAGTESGTLKKTPVELVKQTLQDPWMRNAVKEVVLGGTLRDTYEAVMNEFYLFREIGYSGAGVVLAKGKNIPDVLVGDRVAFAAGGHAEQVAVYANHVMKVPDGVDLRHASFVTVGAIALQGVRRAGVELGDWAAVYGLGLVGQLTVQLLLAAGAKVIGIDLSEQRIALAQKVGVKHTIDASREDVVDAVLRLTGGKGADKTVICAVSSDPVIANNAMKMTRKQGRVAFVGIVKMDLERKPFFERELDLVFSRAYGPGSYDNAYEKGRVEFPYEYVRWTEKRNLAEIIRLIADKKIDLEPLIDSTYSLEKAQEAFDAIKEGNMRSVGVLLEYPQNEIIQRKDVRRQHSAKLKKDAVNIGVIGVGNFTRNYHVPNLNRIRGFHLRALCSASGLNASSAAQRTPADYVTTDYHEILADPDIDAVLIATRHDLHAKIAIEAAGAGKHIFLEKPIALSHDELESVRVAVEESGVCFFPGYNRRYSSLSIAAKRYTTKHPIMMRYTVNIRNLPDSHWTLDGVEGGGRLLGEADHFFDLMNFYAESHAADVSAVALPTENDNKAGMFNFMVQVRYENGCLAQLLYTSMGGVSLPRERLEIFSGDHHIEISDFKKLTVDGSVKKRNADMGHHDELVEFLSQCRRGMPPNESVYAAAKTVLTADAIIKRHAG